MGTCTHLMERRRRPYSVEFTRATKRQVKKEQGGLCAVCGRAECLEVHHIIPVAHGGTRDRSNALGVGKGECHRLLDRLALNYGIYFTMEPGKEYILDKREQSA